MPLATMLSWPHSVPTLAPFLIFTVAKVARPPAPGTSSCAAPALVISAVLPAWKLHRTVVPAANWMAAWFSSVMSP